MKIKPFIELTKPSILLYSLITFYTGYALSSQLKNINWTILHLSLLGCAFIFAGTATLNHILEHKEDSKMERTKKRPIPAKKISIKDAFLFSIITILLGEIILLYIENSMLLILINLILIIYIAIYTPLKKKTWLNTYIGTIAGALPVLCGGYAFSPTYNKGCLFFFILMIIWQLPHFFSISWCYKESYKKAGFKMLSENDEKGKKTCMHIIISTVLLIIWSLIPVLIPNLHAIYLIGASLAGIYLINVSIKFYKNKSPQYAKRLMFHTLLYLLIIISSVFCDLILYY